MVESFVKSRRGILQHIEEGKLGTTDFAIFELLLLLADKANGSCWVSSKVIAAKFGRGDCSERQAKAALHRLKEEGYIHSFREQGSKGSYPILIDKYEITFGDLRGRRVIAEQSVNWRQPVTEPCPDRAPDGVPDTDRDGVRDDVPPYSRPQDRYTLPSWLREQIDFQFGRGAEPRMSARTIAMRSKYNMGHAYVFLDEIIVGKADFNLAPVLDLFEVLNNTDSVICLTTNATREELAALFGAHILDRIHRRCRVIDLFKEKP
jgi:hypothetical protein